MPAATLPARKRRSGDLEDEDDNNISDVATPSTQRNKRSRLNLNGDASPSSQSPLLPDGYLSQPYSPSPDKRLPLRKSSMKHQPGSIVRVKLANFVTYTAVEFYPGPSLNMVIGPNGTGKSTLVCAICLGLGWGAQHLGRAKEVSEYVKHGCQEALVEIELAADPKRHRRNPVIRCNIKRQGNKSIFSLNGKPSNKKNVMEFCKSFSIQIDNLCQFLPQDKVVEFAQMNPIELLRSTQRAVASEEMLEMHEDLKKLRGEQKGAQAQHAGDQETLNNLESRQRMQEADVQRMRERDAIKQRVKFLEAARPFAQYRAARLRHQESKQRRMDATAALKELEEEVEPSLRAVNAKQSYRQQIERVVQERKRTVEKANRDTDKAVAKLEKLSEDIADDDRAMDAERKGSKNQKVELARIEQNIVKLKKQLEEPQEETDISLYTERMREKSRAIREIQEKADELRTSTIEVTEQGKRKNMQIQRARASLENLESQAGQQNNKLEKLSHDTHQAWQWIQEHQDEFEKQVFGPPVVECFIKDPAYVDCVESLFQKSDFLAFTVQTSNDFKKLSDQLQGRRPGQFGLNDITIRNMPGALDNFRSPESGEEMRRFGFEGWALDHVNGPETVMAMLCHYVKLHQTGVALRDINNQQFEMLQNSNIGSWVAGKSSYQITRRSEYGPGATSTRVRDIRKASIWTDQPVDLTAKRELQTNIESWSGELLALKREQEAFQTERTALKQENEELERERKALEQEKSTKQKALVEFKALPTRLAQQEEKQATIKATLAGVRQRIEEISEQQDVKILARGKAALEYAAVVEILRDAHNELLKVEVLLIEASSDLEIEIHRNSSVKDRLEAKRAEVDEIKREHDIVQGEAKKLLAVCQKLMENQDEAVSEFLRNQPEGQTAEELEADIESEKARLELMHEGNGGVIKEFEQRQKKIDQLKIKVADWESVINEVAGRIKAIRERWEPELDNLVKRISDSFAHNMKQINCAGAVGVHKDEDDFDQWAIQIQVKFRESEPLTLLDSHRQSGGERAVSTVFYLMSLQTLTRSPFRVVDEINQGMDPRNERLVHSRLVSIACAGPALSTSSGQDANEGVGGEEAGGDENEDEDEGKRLVGRAPGGGGSQYFLITPKLLHGLDYVEGMRVLCIASGEYMPVEQRGVDFRACVELARGVRGLVAAG